MTAENNQYTQDEIHEVLVAIRDSLRAINQSIDLIIDMAANDKEVGES